ncbi:MAG: RNA polymerase sigma factor [Ignavibacteriaceae bacterium]|nr:RNA polymerase sigma factor [Ignavibacteriaceae bacterium]
MEESRKVIEFTIVFNRYKKKLYNYVLKMVNDRLMTEDIVQNVFLKFFENLSEIQNSSSYNFWLFKTARNEILYYFRSKRVRLDQFNVMSTDDLNVLSNQDIFQETELKEIKELIMKELDLLGPEQKEVFILKEYGGLSYKEISGILEIDEALVKSRLYKVRQKLVNKISKLVQ